MLTGAEEHNVMLTGTDKTVGNVVNYVSEDGTVSVEIQGDGISWVNVENNGKSAWFGLDNADGYFEPGSRFSVRWLEKSSDGKEYSDIMNKLDSDTVSQLSDKIVIMEVGVISPDGKEYSKLPSSNNLYVELGDDWDDEDVRAIFISDKEDEEIMTDTRSVKTPTGETTSIRLKMRHFGEPVGVVGDVSLAASTVERPAAYVFVLIAAVIILIVVMVYRRKKSFSKAE